jgi:hypothetical protein
VLFRCALLSKAALEAPWVVPCGGVPYGEDNLVFVANDWHTSLLPFYLQAHYRDHGKYHYARSVLVLHNVAHQGRGPMDDLSFLEVPDHYTELFRLYDPVGGEHMNIMKAGAITAHRWAAWGSLRRWRHTWQSGPPAGLAARELAALRCIPLPGTASHSCFRLQRQTSLPHAAVPLLPNRMVAVSHGYAWECQTQEGGWGLHAVFQEHAWKLRGVVNGIDTAEWHPDVDPHLQGGAWGAVGVCSLFIFSWDGDTLVLLCALPIKRRGVCFGLRFQAFPPAVPNRHPPIHPAQTATSTTTPTAWTKRQSARQRCSGSWGCR